MTSVIGNAMFQGRVKVLGASVVASLHHPGLIVIVADIHYECVALKNLKGNRHIISVRQKTLVIRIRARAILKILLFLGGGCRVIRTADRVSLRWP